MSEPVRILCGGARGRCRRALADLVRRDEGWLLVPAVHWRTTGRYGYAAEDVGVQLHQAPEQLATAGGARTMQLGPTCPLHAAPDPFPLALLDTALERWHSQGKPQTVTWPTRA